MGEIINFDAIEDCFPEHGALCAVDGRVTVSAQWLHDFASAVAAKEREACAQAAEVSLRHYTGVGETIRNRSKL